MVNKKFVIGFISGVIAGVTGLILFGLFSSSSPESIPDQETAFRVICGNTIIDTDQTPGIAPNGWVLAKKGESSRIYLFSPSASCELIAATTGDFRKLAPALLSPSSSRTHDDGEDQ